MLILFCPLAKAQTDTSEIFLTISPYIVFPAINESHQFDPDFGFYVSGDKKIGDKITLGFNYFHWSVKGDNNPDVIGNFYGAVTNYWVKPIGAPFNFALITTAGYSATKEGTSFNDDIGINTGITAVIKVAKGVYLRPQATIWKFGEAQQNTFTASLGCTFSLW